MADFQNVKYQTDSGGICKIKLDVDTIPQAGTAPSGTITIPGSATVGGNKRRAGIHARHMNLSREVGTSPNVFNKYRRVALLTPAAYTAAIGLVGTTVAIGGVNWEVASVTAEKSR